MTQALSDVVLAHYGVKGMKWGKRKARRAEEKAVKTARKSAVSNARKDILKEALGKQSLGKHAVGVALTGTLYSSAKIMESTGYSRGKSVAASFLAGPFAPMLAINIQANKRVDEAESA